MLIRLNQYEVVRGTMLFIGAASVFADLVFIWGSRLRMFYLGFWFVVNSGTWASYFGLGTWTLDRGFWISRGDACV